MSNIVTIGLSTASISLRDNVQSTLNVFSALIKVQSKLLFGCTPRKYPYPLEIPKGGVSKAKILEGKYDGKVEFI